MMTTVVALSIPLAAASRTTGQGANHRGAGITETRNGNRWCKSSIAVIAAGAHITLGCGGGGMGLASPPARVDRQQWRPMMAGASAWISTAADGKFRGPWGWRMRVCTALAVLAAGQLAAIGMVQALDVPASTVKQVERAIRGLCGHRRSRQARRRLGSGPDRRRQAIQGGGSGRTFLAPVRPRRAGRRATARPQRLDRARFWLLHFRGRLRGDQFPRGGHGRPGGCYYRRRPRLHRAGDRGGRTLRCRADQSGRCRHGAVRHVRRYQSPDRRLGPGGG